MNHKESLDLKKLIGNFKDDYQDNTEYIRTMKHSDLIRENLQILEEVKTTYTEQRKTAPFAFIETAQREAPFLYNNYTDIFNKCVSDELDLDIMFRTLTVLKQIEEGNIDQNEGSVLVGTLLKELYVDSALKRCAKLDEENSKQNPTAEKIEGRPISWSSWKNNGCIEKRNQIIKEISKTI
jgi:hypothetical protein